MDSNKSLDERTPEEWEAGDHISNMKRALEQHVDVAGVCPAHGPVFHSILPALIWVVRRIDIQGDRNVKVDKQDKANRKETVAVQLRDGDPNWLKALYIVMRASPITVLVVGVIVLAYFYMDSMGMLK